MVPRASRATIRRHSLSNGVIAGLAGTMALSVFELLEHALLGRAPVYTAEAVASGLLRRLERRTGAVRARNAGLVLRWSYGCALGAAHAGLTQSGGHRLVLRSALTLSSVIYLFELVAMPATGATKPVRDWPRSELLLLFCHTSAFALVTAAVARLLSRNR